MRKPLLILTMMCCSSLVVAQEVAVPQAYQWSAALTLEAIDNLQGREFILIFLYESFEGINPAIIA